MTELLRLLAGRDPTRGSGQKSVQNLTGQVGSAQELFKSRGSGRVGSRVYIPLHEDYITLKMSTHRSDPRVEPAGREKWARGLG